MPGLRVVRPADANEVAHAWHVHLDGEGPTVFVLSRQNLPVLDGTADRGIAGVAHGAYTLVPAAQHPDVILIGTGSEVALCVEARTALAGDRIDAAVVSMPSWDAFEAQGAEYRESVFPRGVPRVAVEAGSTFGWERHADVAIGIDRFGTSAPGGVALRELGMNVENVIDRVRALLDR